MQKIQPKPNYKVRAAMESTGYDTYDKLAKAIGISVSAFEHKINGKRDFYLNEAKRIAEVLNTTLDALFL